MWRSENFSLRRALRLAPAGIESPLLPRVSLVRPAQELQVPRGLLGAGFVLHTQVLDMRDAGHGRAPGPVASFFRNGHFQ